MESADNGLPMPEIAEREKNFFNGEPPSTIEGKLYYTDLQFLADNIIAGVVNKMQEEAHSKEEILQVVFASVYNYAYIRVHNFLRNLKEEYSKILYENQDAFEACFFMSLCMLKAGRGNSETAKVISPVLVAI